jgi:hypothetical protein
LLTPEAVGVLKGINEREWGRVRECGELLARVDSFERASQRPERPTLAFVD